MHYDSKVGIVSLLGIRTVGGYEQICHAHDINAVC